MELERKKRLYARVLLEIGLDLKQGQPVCIEAPVEAADFVALVAEEAWKLGCGGVSVLWDCRALAQAEMRLGHLSQPAAELAAAAALAEQGAAFLRLDAPDFTPQEGIPDGLLHQQAKQRMSIRTLFRSGGKNNGQTIACIPCQSWADQVFPERPAQQRLEALWQAVLYCARCEEPDPIAAWRQYIAQTLARKAWLDSRHYQQFHYFGGGTELTIRPADRDFWKGGCVQTPDRVSVPNIPTQEVFLTPHKFSAEGHVTATMPLNYGGRLIEGIELTFHGGRIVDCKARCNQKLLEEIIATDEGSHYLGEMALVDQSSPIAQMNRMFYTTLYDENASCHLAIGASIGPPPDPKLKAERGCNLSAVHVDFMVGSEQLCIQGQLPDGAWEDILLYGRLAPTGASDGTKEQERSMLC